jgi:adenosine deaminase
MTEFESFLAAAPKSELHLHLRGALPPALFAGLLRKYPLEVALRNAPAAQLEFMRRVEKLAPFLGPGRDLDQRVDEIYRFESFHQFLAAFLYSGFFFREIDDVELLIAAVLRELAAQNVVYAEITVAVPSYLDQGIALDALLDSLESAASRAPLRVQWIVDLIRNRGPADCHDLLSRIRADRPRSLVGITLGGSEDGFPPAPFADVYRLARANGLRTSVHAGEALGPESVWDALRVLEVERVGHGVRSIEDPALVAYLAEKKVPLEVCPTSNLRTGIYADYKSHPAARLFRAGVPVTINTDDPAFFHTDMAAEYRHLHEAGVEESELVEMMRNGFRHAFLPQPEIAGYLADFERCWDLFLAGRAEA